MLSNPILDSSAGQVKLSRPMIQNIAALLNEARIYNNLETIVQENHDNNKPTTPFNKLSNLLMKPILAQSYVSNSFSAASN